MTDVVCPDCASEVELTETASDGPLNGYQFICTDGACGGVTYAVVCQYPGADYLGIHEQVTGEPCVECDHNDTEWVIDRGSKYVRGLCSICVPMRYVDWYVQGVELVEP